MRLTIKLFAAAKDLAGAEQLEIELPALATVAELRSELVAAHPQLEQVLARSMIAVDQQYAADSTALSETAEIAVIPPVSGG